MIKNDAEYRVAARRLEELERALEELETGGGGGGVAAIPETQRKHLASSRLSLVGDMLKELEEYERLRLGEVSEFRSNRLSDLPKMLIRARIARGLTTAELAGGLKWDVKRLERYEEKKYENAPWRRLLDVADYLKVDVRSGARLCLAGRALSTDEDKSALFESEQNS